MSKISTYEVVPIPKLADRLIGTSVGGEIEDLTYNFTLGELLNLFIPNIPANTLQGVLDYGNTATQDIILSGTIFTTNLEVTDSATILNSYLTEEVHITGGLYDFSDSIGTAGQVLRSTGTSVEWYTIPTIIPTLQQVLQSGNTSDISIILTANITASTATAANVVSNTNLSVGGTLRDGTAAAGGTGQVLSSIGSGVRWVDMPVYTATSPLSINSITRVISIQKASSTQDGYLSSADWITFDGKQDGILLTTLGSSGASTLIGSTLNVPNYTLAGLGGVPQTRTLTINGITYNLSEDRSWTIAAGVSSVSATSPLFSTGGTNPVISIQESSSSLDGYLSSSDWLTFNNKQDTLSLTTTGTSGPATLISNVLNIPQYTDAFVGTVTSVAALTLGTTGTDLSSTVANSTTTPVITLNVPTASAVNRGALSAADWTTFNNKQAAGNYITSLTGEATATGPGAAAITLDNTAVIGKVLTGLNVTGGTVTSTDNILSAFGKVQNQINGLIGGSIFQGTWDASTNTPTLTSGVGTNGYYYIVSVAGTTNLDGITDWQIGDWAIFAGTTWEKVDNTDAVSSVNGYTGTVSLVTGDVLEGAGTLPGRPSQLYFTDARSRAAISLTTIGTGGASTYDSGTGVFNIPNYTTDLSGYVTLATDQTITGLKTILRGGDVLNFKIDTDTLYGLKVAYNQNELVPSGEATWSFVNTFNRDGSGFSVTPLSFFRGVLVTGERLLSASVNANLLDYYGNNPSGRYPVYAYNTGVQQFADSILVGFNTGLVNPATGAIASLPSGVVANFNGRVIGVDAVNNNEFATLGQVTSASRASISLTTTGTSGPATYSSVTGVLNIPEYQGGVTSFNTRTGAVTLTSSDVTTALGYTPVTDLRTLTINGETYNLTANRSWTIGVNPSAREVQTYIATASQTTFTVTGGYTVGLLDVFINGVRLTSSDFTATNGTTVVLAVGTMAGNIVDIIKYTSGFTNAVSGSGTTNELAYFTGSTVIASLSTATYPSLTELSYVKGVTSSIQTQLNGKQASGNYVTLDTTQTITSQKTFTTSGSSDTMIISHGSGSGFALDVIKAGSGEAIRVTKTSGSGNAMTVIGGNFEAPTIVKTGGTSTQYLMANGSVSTLTNPVTGTGTTNYLPKFTGASSIGDSQVFDNGTGVGIGTATISGKLNVSNGNAHLNNYFVTGTSAGWDVKTYFTGGNSGSEQFIYFGYPTAETNAYIQRGSNGRLEFGTAATSRMIIDASGNFGLGVTPSAWGTDFKAIQIGSAGGTSIASDDWNGFTEVLNNVFASARNTYTRIQSLGAARYSQQFGTHAWYSVGTGSGGTTVSFTQAMTLTSGGNLLVGTTTDNGARLQVSGFARFDRGTLQFTLNPSYAGGNVYSQLQSTGDLALATGGDNNRLYINSSGNVGIGTTAPTNLTGYTTLSINNSTFGSIFEVMYNGTPYGRYFASTNTAVVLTSLTSIPLIFATNDIERMRITSVGNFDYGGFNVQSSNNAVYRQAFYGALSIMWRNAEDSYINSNHTYGSSNTNVATYTSSNGIGRMTIGGGELVWSTFNGSVTAGSAYALTDRFVVNKSGNVLIGTTTDAGQRLQVNGAIKSIVSSGGSVVTSESTATNGEGQFVIIGKNSSGTTRSASFKYDNADLLRIGTSSPIDFRFETNDTERMRITSVGRVGIRNTSPQGLLEVGVVDNNNQYGGHFFSTFQIPQNVWSTVFYAPNNSWAAITEFTWTSATDYNRSGSAYMRWAYNAGANALGVVWTLFNDSQNSTATFRQSGGEIQVLITGGVADYYVQVRIQGSKAA